jgi:hypothetical protein
MWLLGSILLFTIFVANVAMGAFAGSPFMGDVHEMLVLFASSTLFVAAILGKEADRNRKKGG